jgi:hypothetical protein
MTGANRQFAQVAFCGISSPNPFEFLFSKWYSGGVIHNG